MSRHLQANISDKQKQEILYQMTELALLESASLISSLGHNQVKFTVDLIGLKNKDDLDKLFNPAQPDMFAVCHQVEGPCSGNIIFLLEENSALQFTKAVLNKQDQMLKLSEMEEEALIELGNIIVNNFLSNYVQTLDESISTVIPTLKQDNYVQLVDELNSEPVDKEFYIVRFVVEIATYNFFAHILWFDHFCQLSREPTGLHKIVPIKD